MVASQQVSHKFLKTNSSLNLSSFQENAHCTRLLYQHGYRIPQVGGDGNIREGEQEQKRKEIVMAEPSSDNQVRLQNQVEALSKQDKVNSADSAFIFLIIQSQNQ